MKSFVLLVLTFTVPLPFAYAQNSQGLPPTDPLYKTVVGLDTELFDAYNNCQLDKLGSLVSEDLEFYHDKTGLAVGRQTFIQATKNNICGKVHRELVPGSLEIYPMEGFGAVEIGIHRFTHPDDPRNLGEAKFITLWQHKDGSWKMTRAISFDHHPANP
ncbi:nuclear transport factor 2 family protein [Occallatibacter savannae]|uniref:nuclear transport factor 2 family protein n=1 Tax=Occallatibacter savannae TaxID=1002691 RepID=UPI001EF5BA56|nr:nuclear transport factor 2 family protein [Occallatibacter savannae]